MHDDIENRSISFFVATISIRALISEIFIPYGIYMDLSFPHGLHFMQSVQQYCCLNIRCMNLELVKSIVLILKSFGYTSAHFCNDKIFLNSSLLI